ncbi:hypothetical protein LOD99_3174 [Oopsacas minuta]|uniref:Uncharacterized protein n=1 Tax=Oopsacas minuta TaxID=111878 RepID=A0AAV7JYH0_9METZ|nr:hypothetical protein LOD99_3174 [Oopsacas minuta]
MGYTLQPVSVIKAQCLGNSQKSQEARSGEYGGWGNNSNPSTSKKSFVSLAVWELTLSIKTFIHLVPVFGRYFSTISIKFGSTCSVKKVVATTLSLSQGNCKTIP